MDIATKELGKYIKVRGFSITAIAKYTGISYGALWNSLSDAKRALRADEFLSVCAFLGIDPAEFRFCKDKTS